MTSFRRGDLTALTDKLTWLSRRSYPAEQLAVVDLDERTVILSKFLERVSVEDLVFIPSELWIGGIVAGKVGAIEDLANLLIHEHATRLKLEKEKHAGVVRTEGAVPDSVINALTLAMLESCTLYDHPPPQTLNDLVSVALRVKRRSARQPRQPEKRSAAIEHMMRNPDMGPRELARIVEVSPSTAHMWIHDPKFQQAVEGVRFLQDFVDDIARIRSKRLSPRCSPR